MAAFDPEFDPDERRPLPYRRAPGARLSSGGTDDEPEYFLRVPGGQLLVLREQERFLWELLDGTCSSAEIGRRFRARFGTGLAPDDFPNFIADLLAAGAIERISDSERVRKIQLDSGNPATVPSGGGATMGARRQAGIGRPRGGMMRRGGREGAGFRAGLKNIWSWKAGNPDRIFAALASVFWPIRYVGWLLIPLVLVGFLISVKHENEYFLDMHTLIISVPLWPCLWLAEHFTTWTGKIFEGTVIYGFGGTVQRVDIKLFMGLFLRCHLEETTVKSMKRRQKLWIAASTLLWRLFCWAFPMLIWAMLRPTRPIIALIAAWEAFMGLASFLVCSCPLIPLYGYKFLETLLDQENLYGRSLRFLWLKMRGRPTPEVMTIADRWGLAIMSVGTTICFSLFVLHVMYSADVWTIQAMAGLGAWLAFAHMAACGFYFFAVWRFSRKLRAMHRAERVRDGPVGVPAMASEV